MSSFDEIKILLKSGVDVLCVSETWLLPEIPTHFIEVDGFNVYRCDGGRGGGVCVYTSKELKAVPISIGLPSCAGVEDVWLRIQSKMLPAIILGAMYRHPHALADSFEYIENSLQRSSLHKKSVFLLEDLNCDLLQPNAKLDKIVCQAKFHQIIEKPTRVTSTSRTLIDVIITNNRDILLSSDVETCNFS
ncbi:MAG: hypothetical protein AAGK97_12785, partial [Bacteroidota bacterium]